MTVDERYCYKTKLNLVAIHGAVKACIENRPKSTASLLELAAETRKAVTILRLADAMS
jgi:hypothetical protein